VNPVSVLVKKVIGAKLGSIQRHVNAVRVYPGVDFHAVGVGGFDGIGQRVKIVVGGFALLTSNVGGPGSKGGRIQGITSRTYLEIDGIYACLPEAIKLGIKISLQRYGRRGWILGVIDVQDRGHPYATEFAFWGLCRQRGGAAGAKKEDKEQGEAAKNVFHTPNYRQIINISPNNVLPRVSTPE
jgi:hypothetical protein